jgi:hypothetical protein
VFVKISSSSFCFPFCVFPEFEKNPSSLTEVVRQMNLAPFDPSLIVVSSVQKRLIKSKKIAKKIFFQNFPSNFVYMAFAQYRALSRRSPLIWIESHWRNFLNFLPVQASFGWHKISLIFRATEVILGSLHSARPPG